MSSLCWECKYEHSDCKGNKWIEKTKCDYFSKKCAINYPQKIRELEELLEQADRRYDILLKENERLLIRADRFEAGNKDLKAKLKQTDEAYYSQGEQLLEALDEIEKLKAKIEERVECGADCSTCEVKCRAWQNGYNAKGGNNHIVQVRHINNPFSELYTFNVPEGLELKKDDIVLCETKGGKPSVARCRTDSVWVGDDVLKMIMGNKKVISRILGKYDLRECF